MNTPPLCTHEPGGVNDDALGVLANRFQAHLRSLGYARGTLAAYGRRIAELCALARERGIAPADLTERTAAEILGRSPRRGRHSKHAVFMGEQFARFLVDQGVATPTPTTRDEGCRAALRREYEAYLRHQRGLSEATIYHCWRLADRFLTFRFGDAIGDPSAVTPADVTGFMHHLHSGGGGGGRPYRVKTTATHLRKLFQFLFKAGKTHVNLAPGIPSVAQRYGSRLRRHLTREQVEAVLEALRTDTTAPGGRRNYAMVLLMARLGLRAPEVVAVRMEDVDWRAGELLVRGKGQRHDRVPLPPDVGAALADYVRLDRVTTSRTVFVTDRAPHRPFKDGQILNTILRGAFARAGVKPPAPYVGSHVLRHSLAVDLVKRGAPLGEVGDLLRHRSRASTLIYAKLDVDGLRSIARPWPAPATPTTTAAAATGGAK